MEAKNSIQEMRARHKQEIDELQVDCEHLLISDWMPYHWAPGHSCGNVKVCRACDKIIEKDEAFLAMTEPKPVVFNRG